eukprot:gene11850-biopygen8468
MVADSPLNIVDTAARIDASAEREVSSASSHTVTDTTSIW